MVKMVQTANIIKTTSGYSCIFLMKDKVGYYKFQSM